MNVPRFLLVLVIAPFGWTLGMLLAQAWVGKDMVAPPPWTLPVGVALAIAFAFLPVGNALIRFAIMLAGTVAGVGFLGR